MSRGLKFHTLDVFTERRFGGNPLAVFTDGADVPGEVMQQIAREMNLSETVFVMPPRDPMALCRLRIFQPAKELPFAGHPTVGSGYLLAVLGRVPLRDGRVRILLEEEVGLVPVSIESRGGIPGFVQLTAAALPSFRDPPADRATLAAMLRLSADDLLDDAQGVSCGLPHLFVPVRDRTVLARADIDVALWRATLGGYWAQQVFIFCRDPELPGSSIRARMYAPESGITEDPATGSACAALGGYLGARAPESDGTLRWVVEQGFEMGRPSILELTLYIEGGRLTRASIAGHAVVVMEGTIDA